jgi:hypothetical protein
MPLIRRLIENLFGLKKKNLKKIKFKDVLILKKNFQKINIYAAFPKEMLGMN